MQLCTLQIGIRFLKDPGFRTLVPFRPSKIRNDLTDPAPATTFAYLDATTVLSRGLAAKCNYPAVDPLDSTSTMLQPRIVGEEHYETAQRVKQIYDFDDVWLYL
ncbi:hypothetical protein RD792_005787 [Penstemon davidsonii]|uniref:H(+)-transporting two-sector ATPase n=1 Tax=Penstemon davidsonii TaxID=160366 RepID=A0ABR0DEC6_9LAMI|nr:hypothetical protein RD792_005787 [Penstemon davidsonii]